MIEILDKQWVVTEDDYSEEASWPVEQEWEPDLYDCD